MAISEDFQAHLATGLTTLARCWRVARTDGETLGFTDHDLDLAFEDMLFLSGAGMSALALEQGNGLSVDNTEALGALSHDAIREEDIAAGRYDGAAVTCWLVNWADVAQRTVLFAGQIGEISRSGGAFRAELQGLSAPLNQPMGRVYQKPCTAVLGDQDCRVDVKDPQFFGDFRVVAQEDQSRFSLTGEADFVDGWFQHGVLRDEVRGLTGLVKSDLRLAEGEQRVVHLWAPMPVVLQPGDDIQLIAGCDKQFATCRFKFNNHLNFRGFPDVPGDEWITTLPRRDGVNAGGSLR